VSYSSNRYHASADIIGTEGALSLDLQSMLVYRYGAKPNLSPLSLVKTSLSSVSQTISGVISNGFKVATGRVRLGHDTVIEQFVESVVNDTRPPVTGEEGREVIRVMEMIVERLYEKYGK